MDFLRALKQEIEQLGLSIREATARRDALLATLKQYEGISSEKRVRANRSIRANRSTAQPAKSKPSKAAPKSKAARMRDLLINEHTTGLTARELIRRMKGMGIRTTDNAVYAALTKAKQRKEVTIRGGRYFPSQSLLNTESAQRRS